MADVRSMKPKIDNADRISALPEPLLQHIMSFLPSKDAVRTRLLSKIWEKAWCTFPVLNFDEDLFERELLEMRAARGDVQKFNQARGKLLNYWKQALEAHRHHCSTGKLSVEKLRFKASFLDDSELADRCVCYAIESTVKELELHTILRGDRLYHLPQMVVCSETVNVLDLFGCILLEFPGRNSVKLPSLRKLRLAQVRASDQVIENLVAGCPLIEDLIFEFCEGLKSIKLFGRSKLRDIKIKGGREAEEVNINALNGHSITVVSPLPSGKINEVSCKNLKSLFLCITSVVDETLSYHITRLVVLECLGLIVCFELQNIKISSPSLKRLEIFKCTKLAAVEIETPNLSKCKYNGGVVPFSSSTALKLLETDLNLYTINFDPQWYVKFIELIAKFHQWSKVLNLLSECGESVIVPKELRQILPPPLSGVKHLNFSISIPFKKFAIAQVVDGLLWMSPHVDTVTIEYGRAFRFCFQILYKKDEKIEFEMISKGVDFNSARMVFEDEDILKKIIGLEYLIWENNKLRWICKDQSCMSELRAVLDWALRPYLF
ncbi:putative F-box protein [Citrus sinensis]|nr:putative F-box protein [Citrus sinensis]